MTSQAQAETGPYLPSSASDMGAPGGEDEVKDFLAPTARLAREATHETRDGEEEANAAVDEERP